MIPLSTAPAVRSGIATRTPVQTSAAPTPNASQPLCTSKSRKMRRHPARRRRFSSSTGLRATRRPSSCLCLRVRGEPRAHLTGVARGLTIADVRGAGTRCRLRDARYAARVRDAGDFSDWLDGMVVALRDGVDADVPCDGCTACCTSSQFVHIAPDETDTLAHVPPELLFPAPRRPAGHVLLGYDERGHCPMLVDGACTIYAHRPRTCRAYDCRVFVATDLPVDDDATPAIAARVAEWRFRTDDVDASTRLAATRAAAVYLVAHAAELPRGAVPPYPPQLGVLALTIHELFLDTDPA